MILYQLDLQQQWLSGIQWAAESWRRTLTVSKYCLSNWLMN